MIALVLALVAATGVALLWSGDRPQASSASPHLGALLRGVGTPHHRTMIASVAVATAAGALGGWLLFGGAVAPLLTAALVGSWPIASARQRATRRRAAAADAWPRMIEEVRLLCGSLGRPVPQALLEVGRRAPAEVRPAFALAEREWLISTDFSRCVRVLAAELDDATADVVCETLLVAHEVGGGDVDRRLAALAADRQMDLQSRKDARARQAGVRFARRFVLIVPIGMALAGMSIGDGRAAYATTGGQAGVAFGLLTLAACWVWAGRLIRLPVEARVFDG